MMKSEISRFVERPDPAKVSVDINILRVSKLGREPDSVATSVAILDLLNGQQTRSAGVLAVREKGIRIDDMLNSKGKKIVTPMAISLKIIELLRGDQQVAEEDQINQVKEPSDIPAIH